VGSRRGPLVAIALVAVVLVVAAAAYAVSALSGSGVDTSSGSSKVTLPDRAGTSQALPSPKRSHSAVPQFHLVAAFYLGPGPRGPVLHRTVAPAAPGTDRLALALESLEEQPEVPQYHTWWRPGWLVSASRTDGHIDVDVGDAPAGRPPAMDAATASRSLQQVVYTLQAAAHSHERIQFTRHGKPASSVFGVPATHPVLADPPVQVLSLMNVLEPEMDEGYQGHGPYTVSGTADTAQGLVTVRLELHGQVLQTRTTRPSGSGTPGSAEGLLSPWHVDVSVRGLAHGTYQVVASGPDPVDPSVTLTDQRPLHLG
jgi:hypothetical protein